MSVKPPFLAPRLVGARFDHHSIPLHMLRDFVYLELLLVEAAKWRYRQAYPSLERTPKGFIDSVTLRLTSMDAGNCASTIELTVEASDGRVCEVGTCFEQARDSVLGAISAASRNEALTDHLPAELLTYFDGFGRSLKASECIEFDCDDEVGPVRLDQTSRRRLVLASNKFQEISQEERLRGWIFAVNKKREEFQLKILGGPKVKGSLATRHAQTILEAFNTKEENAKVLVTAITVYDQHGRIKAINEIEHISRLDPNDIMFRIEELKLLEDEWLDGNSVPPPLEQLDWFARNFESHCPADLPYPLISPSAEGGLLAEWSVGELELSLQTDLAKKSGQWQAHNTKTYDAENERVDLGTPEGWKNFFAAASRFLGPTQ